MKTGKYTMKNTGTFDIKKIMITSAAFVLGASMSAQAATLVMLDEDFSGSNYLASGVAVSDIGTGVWNGNGWALSGGSLNKQTEGAAGDRGVGLLLDVRSITDPQFSLVNLEVSFTTATSTERLYTHIRGYVDPDSDPGDDSGSVANTGATNGNLWNDAFSNTDWGIYNLHSGILNDHASNFSSGSQALQLTDGVAGLHNYSTGFFLHNNEGGFTSIADYSYIGIYFTRESGSTDGTQVEIHSVLLRAVAAPEPSSLALLLVGGGMILGVRNRKKLS